MIKFLRQRLLVLLALLAAGVPVALGQEHFSRNLKQISFVPKGQWLAGVSVSYTQSSQDNYKFLIVENLNGDTYSFKVSPTVMYSFHDNLAAGGRFAYQRQRTKLDESQIILGSDDTYDIDNLYSISQNYFATACFRNYISLGNSTRFGLFNEVQLQFGGGQSKLVNGVDDNLTGTFERNFQFGIGVAPGICMFLNNYSAIEVNVGVLGFNYNHTKSTTDQIYVARRTMKSANFRVNLFSITFGMMFYI